MGMMDVWDLDIGIRDLLEAGLHFGHQSKRWNPRMKRYIFDKRNGIHVIDLAKSLVHIKESCKFSYDTVASGRKILFVGTKRQIKEAVEEKAIETGQYYVTNRWLGGTLTNANTVRRSVRRMKDLERQEKEGVFDTLAKKEVSRLQNELDKLRRNLSGIADMDDLPGALFVVDITREAIAVAEANKLKIPVIAMVDTNCNPELVDYPIPGNDDAIRAVKLVLNAVGDAIKKASLDYEKIAAELARKREQEKAAAQATAAKQPENDAKPRARRERKPAAKTTKPSATPKTRAGKTAESDASQAQPAAAPSEKSTAMPAAPAPEPATADKPLAETAAAATATTPEDAGKQDAADNT